MTTTPTGSRRRVFGWAAAALVLLVAVVAGVLWALPSRYLPWDTAGFPDVDRAALTVEQARVVDLLEVEHEAQRPGTFYSEGVREPWCADFVSLGRGGQIFGQQGEQVLQCAHQQAGFARNGEACSAEQRDLRVDKEHGAGENPPGFRPAERRVNQGLVQGAQPVVQFGRFFLGVDRGALLQTRDQRPQTFTRAGRCQSLVFAASFFHVGRKYESLSPFMVSIAVSLFVWGVLFLTVRSCSGSKVQNISLFFRAFLI